MPDTIDPGAAGSAEQQIADAITELRSNVGVLMKHDYGKMTEEVAKIAGTVEGLEKLDIAKTHELINEKIDNVEALATRIKNSVGPMAGLEDTDSSKFSMGKAAVAVTGSPDGRTADEIAWDKFDAGYEGDVLKTYAQEMTKREGHVSSVAAVAGVWVPMTEMGDIFAAFYASNPFFTLPGTRGESGAQIIANLRGGKVTWTRNFGGTIAFYDDEDENAVVQTLGGGQIDMEPKKLTCATAISENARKFATEALRGGIRVDMVNAMNERVTKALLYSAGGKDQPLGLFSYQPNSYDSPDRSDTDYSKIGVNQFYAQLNDGGPGVAAPGTPTGGELDFDGLHNMLGIITDQNIPMNDSVKFIAADRFWRRRQQQKVDSFASQTANQAYLLGLPMLSREAVSRIVGYNLSATEVIGTKTDIGGEAKFTDVAVGRLSEMLFGVWEGVALSTDRAVGAGFLKGREYLRITHFHDSVLREPRAFTVCRDARARE